MTFLYENLNGFFSLLDLFDIEKLMEPSQNFMDCIFVKIRYVTQIPKGQEMFWTGRTHPIPAYLDECSNDSVMSTSSRLDESQAKLGEIADRLDSFFCEDDPILLPSSTSSTSDKSSENLIPGKEFCTTFLFVFCLI